MEPVVRWLLTYLVHSTLLLGAAGLARLALRERRLALQEALLRAALVGGFVTAGLQVGLELRPLAGSLAVPVTTPASALVSAPASAGVVPVAATRPSEPSVVTSSLRARGTVAALAAGWRPGLAIAWAALAGAGLAGLAVAALRLRRLLRRPVPVSVAERLSVPLATGVLRPEVCLPARAVHELGADEQAALCAHELAHVARRDPAWILLARLAEARKS
jgi:Zn-dependent protease with chaperone function